MKLVAPFYAESAKSFITDSRSIFVIIKQQQAEKTSSMFEMVA